MTVAIQKTKFTPDDLLAMPDGVAFELVDGNLVERQMGAESSVIAGIILTLLNTFIRGKRLGFAAGADCSYQCFRDAPHKVRRPDVSYVRPGRLAEDRPAKGHMRVAPDLAVEVLSPRDLAEELDAKLADYQSAGVTLIWVVNPDRRTVQVYRASDPRHIFTLNDTETITGEDVLPGFECRVAEFFEL